MRLVQQVKLTFNNGKQTDKENIGDQRTLIDSASEYYSIKAENDIENAKNSKGINIIKVYEDKGESKKPLKAKPEAKQKAETKK